MLTALLLLAGLPCATYAMNKAHAKPSCNNIHGMSKLHTRLHEQVLLHVIQSLMLVELGEAKFSVKIDTKKASPEHVHAHICSCPIHAMTHGQGQHHLTATMS